MLCWLLPLLVALLQGGTTGKPAVDHHQHLFSPALAQLIKASQSPQKDLVQHLDDAGIRRAVVLSTAVIFLNELLPAAPEVPVQIAHMGGAGGVEPSVFDGVLDVLVEAIAKGDPSTRNLWFDVTSVAANLTPENAQRIVARIRQLGLQRILYGSDAAAPDNLPRIAWEAFRKLPLTDAEFRRIESNVAPYMR